VDKQLWETNYVKECRRCGNNFKTQNKLQAFCSGECKQEALSDLDKDSNECLSCQ